MWWWWWWCWCLLLVALGWYWRWWWWWTTPSSSSLARDLQRLERAGFIVRPDDDVSSSTTTVRHYFEQTADRDYRWLEMLFGSGRMHTRLVNHPRTQPELVLDVFLSTGENENAHEPRRRRVLEVGCGRGHCTLCLAQRLPEGVDFVGLDLVPCHIEDARRRCPLLDPSSSSSTNVRFVVGDVLLDHTTLQQGGPYDVIFGCESLCYMDTPRKARTFLRQAHRMLVPATGRLVIIDGFRSPSFATCPPDQRRAMRIAEEGFRIGHHNGGGMPSKAAWRRWGEAAGFRVVRDVDLTEEARPFWNLGWRVAHTLLAVLPAWVFRRSIVKHWPETAANFQAVAMVAHALRGRGAAEYGMLVLAPVNGRTTNT